PMPASDGPDADANSAARRYAAELPPTAAAAAAVVGTSPWLDICLLGIGEDAHVASLFPGRHEAVEPATVVAVHDSPKPPPTRTTFTMSVICSSDEVWLIAAGEGKAQAVQRTLAGLPLTEAPAGSARGRSHTVLFADQAAVNLVRPSGG
ncbi:MAG: 6-phosphogluconolactonase, partial [Candidatus Nanopelagicales bacterium]|nr:6-phosphogluconolactonase [Candidatus Nanopelagicales bacterium]